MKKSSLILLFYLSLLMPVLANGVAIYNDPQGLCFTMIKSQVDVTVNNQVAVIKTTQTFRNNMGLDATVK